MIALMDDVQYAAACACVKVICAAAFAFVYRGSVDSWTTTQFHAAHLTLVGKTLIAESTIIALVVNVHILRVRHRIQLER